MLVLENEQNVDIWILVKLINACVIGDLHCSRSFFGPRTKMKVEFPNNS